MNFLLKVRADSSSIYDASEYGNIFYTDYKVYTRLDNPFNNNTYCIDTTQGDAWGFPRIGGSNLKFRRNFSKFSVLT